MRSAFMYSGLPRVSLKAPLWRASISPRITAFTCLHVNVNPSTTRNPTTASQAEENTNYQSEEPDLTDREQLDAHKCPQEANQIYFIYERTAIILLNLQFLNLTY